MYIDISLSLVTETNSRLSLLFLVWCHLYPCTYMRDSDQATDVSPSKNEWIFAWLFFSHMYFDAIRRK